MLLLLLYRLLVVVLEGVLLIRTKQVSGLIVTHSNIYIKKEGNLIIISTI